MFDPIIASLEQRDEINILADARTSAGTQQIFGGPYASGCLYAEAGWLPGNQAGVRDAAAAIVEAVDFLKTATAE